MKFIIIESTLIRLAKKWFRENFTDLELSHDENLSFVGWILFEKNGVLVYEYGVNSHQLFVNAEVILKFLREMFDLTDDQIYDIIRESFEFEYGYVVEDIIFVNEW